MKYRVKQHPTLNDKEESGQLIDEFAQSMPTKDLYQCADATALLVESTGSCGVAYFDSSEYCHAVSVTKKSCATGYYR